MFETPTKANVISLKINALRKGFEANNSLNTDDHT